MRLIDLILSILSLTILFPVFLILIPLLRFTGEGEIFYRQERVGQNLKKIQVLKFATMQKNSPFIGAGTITEKDDPRVLPMGKFLRRTKINELPQLINIFFGDMSIIGPRPHAPRDLRGVNQSILKKSLSVKPGLSGIASIIFRNEEDILHNTKNPREIYDNLIAPYKAELECWYVDNKNLRLYFELIFFTFLAVIGVQVIRVDKYYKNLPAMPKVLMSVYEQNTKNK